MTNNILEICKIVQEEFTYSHRRVFFMLIEARIRKRIEMMVAWPDLLFFATPKDFLDSYQEIKEIKET